MTLDLAIRATEVLLALAFLQQSAEHMAGPRDERLLLLPRLALAVVLLAGIRTECASLALTLHSFLVLLHFRGPYNGGSDRMGLLVLYCLTLAHWLPEGTAREMAFAYLSVQVILSYFISGQVKITNPDWRSGKALADVFRFSAYPVSESLRGLADRPRLLWVGSWAVMLFEVAFPLSLLSAPALMVALVMAAGFHIANACLFGLNRFVFAWISAYPALLWFQGRLL